MPAVVYDAAAIIFVVAGFWQIYIGDLYRRANISFTKGQQEVERGGPDNNHFFHDADRLYAIAQRYSKRTAPWQHVKDKRQQGNIGRND